MKAIKGHQMRYYKKGLEMIMSITKGHIRSIPCSLLSDCKNVQKFVLKSVNVQRTGKSILQKCHRQVSNECHPNLYLDSIGTSSIKVSEGKILLDLLEE